MVIFISVCQSANWRIALYALFLHRIRRKMSVVGLDFGSHAASIALWYENTDKAEVIADDLGFRTIPCAVAFRTGKLSSFSLEPAQDVETLHFLSLYHEVDARRGLRSSHDHHGTSPLLAPAPALALDRIYSRNTLSLFLYMHLHTHLHCHLLPFPLLPQATRWRF